MAGQEGANAPKPTAPRRIGFALQLGKGVTNPNLFKTNLLNHRVVGQAVVRSITPSTKNTPFMKIHVTEWFRLCGPGATNSNLPNYRIVGPCFHTKHTSPSGFACWVQVQPTQTFQTIGLLVLAFPHFHTKHVAEWFHLLGPGVTNSNLPNYWVVGSRFTRSRKTQAVVVTQSFPSKPAHFKFTSLCYHPSIIPLLNIHS